MALKYIFLCDKLWSNRYEIVERNYKKSPAKCTGLFIVSFVAR
jgi:hypothetical protein